MIVTKLTSWFSKRGVDGGEVEGKDGMKNSNDVIINVDSSHETKAGGRLKERFTNREDDGLEMGNLSKELREQGTKTKKKEKEKGDTLVVNPLLVTRKMIK